jgi:hypothetical protein
MIVKWQELALFEREQTSQKQDTKTSPKQRQQLSEASLSSAVAVIDTSCSSGKLWLYRSLLYPRPSYVGIALLLLCSHQYYVQLPRYLCSHSLFEDIALLLLSNIFYALSCHMILRTTSICGWRTNLERAVLGEDTEVVQVHNTSHKY